MTVSSPDVLRSVPLFEGMTEASIDSIGRLTHPIEYGSGDALVREGDPGETFIIMVTGRAVVDQGGKRIREMSAGDFLGEISLIDHGPRTATVTAVEPIDALVVGADDFGRLMDDHPAVRLEILTALTQRIRRTAAAVSD
jgi:CRP-like cAMP-binding protein